MKRKGTLLSDGDSAKERATELLMRLAAERRGAAGSERIATVMTDELVMKVLDLAWEHQWERESEAFLRAVRPLVLEAAQEAVSTDED